MRVKNPRAVFAPVVGILTVLSGCTASPWVLSERYCLLRQHAISSLSVTSDGEKIIANDGRTCVLSARSGDILSDVDSGKMGRASLSLSPDGVHVAVAGYPDSALKDIAVYDIRSNAKIWDSGGDRPGIGVSYSEDGTKVAVSRGGVIEIIKSSDGDQLHILDSQTRWLSAPAFGPTGAIIAAGSLEGKIWLWDLKSNQLIATLSIPGSVRSVAISPDGMLLAAGGSSGIIYFFDLNTKQLRSEVRVCTSAINCVAFSPSRNYVAIGCGAPSVFGKSTGSLSIIDSVTFSRRAVATKKASECIAVSISKDGQAIFAAFSNGLLGRWDVID